MELMQRIAKKHDLVCLLHEKPFAGVNGSGKHNNWSISTNTGVNLLEPGETPYENAQFLLFLCAVIKAVDEYQDMLRLSAASAGNDHRLGANEAPPAIVSMFLGSELTEILEAIEQDTSYDAKEKELMRVGVHVLPKFQKDTTDRNRTSPFAFTGNKFEFRMLGSSASIAGPNMVLNTAVAEELRQFADQLEGSADFANNLHRLIQRVIKEHKRIIFNDNGYDEAWVAEAERRGLLNLKTTPDALPYFVHQKNIQLFTTHKVFSEDEMYARYEIMMENYTKTLNIEALTMVDMVRKDILPAVSKYVQQLAGTALAKKSLSPDIDSTYETRSVKIISQLSASVFQNVETLENDLVKAKDIADFEQAAFYYKDVIFSDMTSLRAVTDELESITSSQVWPYPSYGKLLFGIL